MPEEVSCPCLHRLAAVPTGMLSNGCTVHMAEVADGLGCQRASEGNNWCRGAETTEEDMLVGEGQAKGKGLGWGVWEGRGLH